MTETQTPTADLARAIDTLQHLDPQALGIITAKAQLAYEVQEATKAEILRVLRPAPTGGK